MKVIIAYQNLLDLAVQNTGSIEAVFDLAMANDLSITDHLEIGESLNAVEVLDQDIANYFNMRNRHIATDIAVNDIELELPSGISFWGINNDFIVQ